MLLLAAQVATADSSFTDPAGDSAAAPDITAVSATNDGAGNISIRVTTNQASLSADAFVAVSLDTDKNVSTGDSGIDYLFVLSSGGWSLLKWNGSDYEPASVASASAGYASGAATFKASKTDLGIADSFVFYVDTAQVDSTGDNVLASDTAPDGTAVYTYTLSKPPPPRPTKFSITRSDTGGGLANGTAACSIKIGTAGVAATGSVKAGIASCSFQIPASGHAKLIHGSIKVVGAGASVTKTFSKRVS